MLILVQAFEDSVQLPKVFKTRLGYPQMDNWFGREEEEEL